MNTALRLAVAVIGLSLLAFVETSTAGSLPKKAVDASSLPSQSIVGGLTGAVPNLRTESRSDSQGFPLQFLFAVGELGQPGIQAVEVGFAAASDGGYYAVGDHTRYPATKDVPWVYRYNAKGVLIGSWRSNASDVAVAPDDTVWVAEPLQNRIAHYSAWGAYLGSVSDPATSGTGERDQLCAPAHVTVGADGSVYGASGCGLLLRFDPETGETLSATRSEQAAMVRDLAAAPDGRLYAAMTASVAMFDRNGQPIDIWSRGKGEGPGEFGTHCVEMGYRGGCILHDTGPHSVIVAPDGSIWASDRGNGRIHRYDAEGAWLGARSSKADHFTLLTDGTIASNGTQPQSGRAMPSIRSLDVSHDGFVVVAPQYQVVVLGPDGHAANWFGSPDWDTGTFNRATAVAYDPDGSIYVALDHSVLRYSTAGTYLGGWLLGADAPQTRRYLKVADLSVADDGSVFVADGSTWGTKPEVAVVTHFSPDGTLMRSWHAADLGLTSLDPVAVDCAADGDKTLILDRDSKQVVTLSASGEPAARWFSGAAPPEDQADSFVPEDVAAAPDGSVLVTYYSAIGRVLRRYTADGLLISQQDALGDRIAVGLDGTIYFSGNGSVGRASLDGSPLLAWRYPPPGHGAFAVPAAVAAGAGGSVVVLDHEHQRMQELGLNGELSTTWGMSRFEVNTSGTGGLALAANGDALVTTGWGYPSTDSNYQVLRIDRTGTVVATIGTPIDHADSVYWASAVAIADTGEAVVADTSKRRLVRLDVTGRLLHATPLEWLADHEDYEDAAHDIAVTGDGTALVVGASLEGVARYSRDGERLADWGVDPSLPMQLSGLSSVALSGHGGCYVSDTAHNEIVEFDSSGGFVRRWTPTENRNLLRIAAGSSIVAALTGSGKSSASHVDTFSSDGKPITSWPLPFPGQDVDIDASGNIVVTLSDPMWHLERLLVYKPDGNSYSEVELPRWWPGMRGTRSIAVGANGRVFVAMRGGVFGFDRDGSLASVWRDVSGANGRLYEPTGVTAGRSQDGRAEIYVSNTGLGRVEVFTEDGRHLRTIGTEGSQPGQFHEPRGLALAEDGSLYVADRRNDRVQRVDAGGNVTGVWDGFLNPIAVAVDPDGTLYVLHDGGVEARSPSEEHLGTLQPIGLSKGQMVEPVDMTMSKDTLWVVDRAERRVLAFGKSLPPAWRASFFRDATWSDGPMYVTTSETIDYDWGTESPAPGVPTDGYAVRFERLLPMNGPYSWDLTVEGEAAFSPGPGKPATVVSGHPAEARVAAPVEGEPVRVHVDYIDTGDGASIRLVPRAKPRWTHAAVLPAVSLPRLAAPTGEARATSTRQPAATQHRPSPTPTLAASPTPTQPSPRTLEPTQTPTASPSPEPTTEAPGSVRALSGYVAATHLDTSRSLRVPRWSTAYTGAELVAGIGVTNTGDEPADVQIELFRPDGSGIPCGPGCRFGVSPRGSHYAQVRDPERLPDSLAGEFAFARIESTSKLASAIVDLSARTDRAGFGDTTMSRAASTSGHPRDNLVRGVPYASKEANGVLEASDAVGNTGIVITNLHSSNRAETLSTFIAHGEKRWKFFRSTVEPDAQTWFYLPDVRLPHGTYGIRVDSTQRIAVRSRTEWAAEGGVATVDDAHIADEVVVPWVARSSAAHGGMCSNLVIQASNTDEPVRDVTVSLHIPGQTVPVHEFWSSIPQDNAIVVHACDIESAGGGLPEDTVGWARVRAYDPSNARVAVHALGNVPGSAAAVAAIEGVEIGMAGSLLYAPIVHAQWPVSDDSNATRLHSTINVVNPNTEGITASVKVTYTGTLGSCAGETYVDGPFLLNESTSRLFDPIHAGVPSSCIAAARIEAKGRVVAAVIDVGRSPMELP